VDCCGGLWVGADTGNFGILLVPAEVIENCLKSALVAEITPPKVPKEADFLSLPSSFFKFSHFLPLYSRGNVHTHSVKPPDQLRSAPSTRGKDPDTLLFDS
jgi:hypothetical protein